jgi:hypothetical protein
MKKSKMVSSRVPIDFIKPISRRRVTISSEIVVETTTTPRTNTSRSMDHTKVEKNVPNDVDRALPTVKVDTSRRTLPKRNTKVIAVTALVRESSVSVVLKGRRFRSFEANI